MVPCGAVKQAACMAGADTLFIVGRSGRLGNKGKESIRRAQVSGATYRKLTERVYAVVSHR